VLSAANRADHSYNPLRLNATTGSPNSASNTVEGSGTLDVTVMVPLTTVKGTLAKEESERLVQEFELEQFGTRVTLMTSGGVSAAILKKI
jgi:hypothetical protein